MRKFFYLFAIAAVMLGMASCGDGNTPEQAPFALKLVRQSDALLEVTITPVDNQAPYIFGLVPTNLVWEDHLLTDYVKKFRLKDHTYQELVDNKEIKSGVRRIPEENLEPGKEFIFYVCQVDEELNIVHLVFKHYATLQPGRLCGEFQIDNERHKVRFSKGNLRLKRGVKEYYFAENQWDAMGEENKTAIDWDLLPWGLAEGYYPYYTDFGTQPIVNGGNEPNQWRTLTADEWEYIIKNNQVGYGAIAGVEGLILVPREMDDVELKKKDNFFTQKEWWEMEVLGAVFLPLTGWRGLSSSVDNLDQGFYWSSTLDKNNESEDRSTWYLKYLHIDNNLDCNGAIEKTKWTNYGFLGPECLITYSVRLVQDIN